MQSYSKILQDILRALDWGNEPVMVVGHRSPDSDSVFAALSYATLMREMGFTCQAYMAGTPNKETLFAADYFDIQLPETIYKVEEDQRVILVDHSEYSQAVDGTKEARIIQIIDHHGIGDIQETNRIYYKSMPVGATCTVIFMTYLETGLPISAEQAKTMLCGIISDTRNLTKSHTEADEEACRILESIAGLSDEDTRFFAELMRKSAQSYDGLSDREIFLSDFKEYIIEGVKIGIGSLDCNALKAEEFVSRIHSVMQKIKTEKDDEMLFAKIDEDGKGTHILFCGEGSQTIIESIFGKSADDKSVFTTERVNRKSRLLPAISERIRHSD